jgi:hypothetical protein
MKQSLLVLTVGALLLPALSAQQAAAPQEPESSDSAARELRQTKSTRYNGGRCDITATTEDHECFFEQYEPAALPVIPLDQSTIVCIGQVTKAQPYLSADRTHIYTEITVRSEELLKHPGDFRLSSDRTLIADQLSGGMKLSSGRVVSDNTRAGFMGKPRIGGRYVLFLRQVHEGMDLEILKAYELRDGKVFKLTEDGSTGKVMLSKTPNKPDAFSEEQTFVEAVKRALGNPTGL